MRCSVAWPMMKHASLRRFQDGPGKAVSLTLRMQPGGSSADLLSISAEALPLSIDVCPANISGIATFWDQSRRAIVQVREELISESRPTGHSSATQSRRLSIRVAIPGISISCPSDGDNLVPGLVVVSRDVVVVLNEAEGAFPGCPASLSGNLLLQAVQMRAFGPGLSANGDAVLSPLDAHVTIKLIPGGTALVLDTPVIELHISPARLHALLRASGAFTRGKQDPPAGDRVAPSEAGEGRSGRGSAPSEDLRCGLFERTQVAASRPGPLQFSYGDKQPGLMPWSGQGESWICWRYPYPRSVTTVLIALPLEVLKSADLELLAFSPAADCFIPVECNMAALSQPDLSPVVEQCNAAVLLSLKAAAVVAEEWQLCWEVPPDAPYLRASFMLHHTYVNPSAGVDEATEKYVAPLKVPITLGLAAQQMEVQMTDDAVAASCPELGGVSVHDVKVAVHMWKGAVAARAAGALQLSCVDETSLCMETILAPSRFSLALESARLNSPQVAGNDAGLRHLASGRLDLTLPFPAPGTEGLAVSCRCCEGPVVVHLSELGTHSLLRVVKRASLAFAAHNKKEGEQKRLGAASPVILLENQTQLVLETRQVGSSDQVVLRPGGVHEHIWAHERGGGLKRLLQLRVAEKRNAEGETEALHERRASNATASTSGAAHPVSCWSRALDILSPGMTICEVPTNEPGVAAVVAVHVSKLSGRWSISLLPGCSVENHSAHKLLLAHLSLLPGSAAQVSANITLGFAGCSTSEPAMRRLQPYVARREGVAAKTLTTVRLWMGQGNGWSHPVPLSSDSPCQVTKAQAAGFGGSSPSAPAGNPTHTPGPLHLHTSASPSHRSLAVWPAFLLENHLPIPLLWRVRHPSQSDGDAQPPATRCPPGGEVPLEGYVSGEDSLAVKLDLGDVTTGVEGGPEDGWSQGMASGGRAGSYGWGLSSAAQHALPAPGQTRVLELACGPSTLAVNLSAEHARPGVPCLRLKVSPAGVVQNCTSLPVRLHPQGASVSEVQPGKIAAVDWQPLRQRPGKASLSHTTSEGICLLSEPFALEAGDIWLTLRAPLPGGQGGAVLYLGMRLEVSQFPAQASTPSCETVHLTVTPGCFVTNLTPWQLLCQPSKIVGPSAASQIQVGQKASVPLTRVWATKASALRGSGAAASSKRLLEKGVDGGVGVYVSIFDPGGNPLASPVADSGPGTSGGSFVDLSGPQPRHRLQLGAGGGSHLVTCRVISSRGHLHAVLFQDRKPPVLLQNTTAVALEVGYFLPEVNKLGEVQHEAAEAVFFVPGNGCCECSFTADPLLGGDDWDEDEESFLERVTGVSSPSNGHIGKLKLRRQGSTAWSEACDIVEPSLHNLGDLQLEMHRSCASLRCIISDPPQAAKDLSQPPAALPTSIAFEIQNVQVCLLEDERGKWRDLEATSGTTPLELFCISLSDLRLSLQQQSPPGGHDGVGPRRRLHSVNVAAQALQIDSYLPDSSHPVLCSSVPGRPQRLKGIQEDNPLPPLLLALQVEHDAGQGDGKGMSFRNTWLRSLGVRLPTLALAVDDALIGFAERLANILGAPPAVTPLPTGDAQGAPKAEPRVPSRTEAPRLSPRKPYFDLSGLDSLDPDSRLAHLQDPRPPPGSVEGVPGLAAQVATALEVELLAEATAASASRLLIEVLSLGRVSLLLDLHASQGNQHIPMSIDTHRTPLGLPEVVADSLHFRPSVMLQGLLAHYAAEALLNAPAVLGSLDLLLNPTGLMNSLARGFEDLVSLPLAALEARSPSQFVAGLGLGSASMVRHVSGWTLTSISGFSSAFSRVLHHSLSVQGSTRGAAQNRRGAGGIAGGLQGLAGGVSQGVTGLYRAPLAGYSSGSGGGLALGMGRGLLGAVGLPLSGALDLVSSISTGIANTAGIAHHPRLRRPGLTLGDLYRQAAATRFRRWASHRQEEYVGHCMPLLVLGAAGQQWATPIALLTSTSLHLLDGSSLCPLLHLPLAGMSMREDSRASKIQLLANATSSPSGEAWQVSLELGVAGWHLWLPLLRSRLL